MERLNGRIIKCCGECAERQKVCDILDDPEASVCPRLDRYVDPLTIDAKCPLEKCEVRVRPCGICDKFDKDCDTSKCHIKEVIIVYKDDKEVV